MRSLIEELPYPASQLSRCIKMWAKLCINTISIDTSNRQRPDATIRCNKRSSLGLGERANLLSLSALIFMKIPSPNTRKAGNQFVRLRLSAANSVVPGLIRLNPVRARVSASFSTRDTESNQPLTRAS